MNTQLHVAFGLIESRARVAQDQPLVRAALQARTEQRAARRAVRRATRRAV